MNEEAKQLIDRISSISDNVKKDLKPLVQKLAKNIGDNIDKAEIKNLAALEGIKDPEIKDVASIMNRLRKKYEWSLAKQHYTVTFKRNTWTQRSRNMRNL